MALSYAHGASAQPLLGETIGENLERTAARASPTARRSSSATRACAAPTASSTTRSTALARGLLALGLEQGDRVGIWSPNCAEWVLVQYATAQASASILVNVNPAYRTSELEYALRQSGCRVLVAAPRVQDARDYVAMVDGGARRRCPTLERVDAASTRPSGTSCSAAATAVERRRAARARGRRCSSTTRSTSSTRAAPPASPRARRSRHHNILNNGYFVGEGCGYTEADRVCIPVPFYHCFGMVMGNLGCTTHGAVHGHPGAGVRARRDAARRSQDERCTALYGVPTMFIAELDHPDFAELRPVVAAHRDHGRLAVPGRGDEAGASTEMHMDEVTICYGMTETSPVSTQTARRRPARASASARSGASTRTSRSRSSTPTTGRASCRAASRASCARAATRDARLLERPGAHRARRSTRRAGCTPATSRRWTTTATSTSSAASRT